MPILAWRMKTAPAVVPYYDEAQDVVVLRVVKKAQRRSATFKIPSKSTSSTMDSHESVTTSMYDSGLYSSEGEAIPSFPVEVQTDSITLRNTAQNNNSRPRFVYCEGLKQNIIEEIDFVDFRCDQNEDVDLRSKPRLQALEPRTGSPEEERHAPGSNDKLPREAANLLDLFRLVDYDTATLGTATVDTATMGPHPNERNGKHFFPQAPSSEQPFSVLCSPVFACSPVGTKSITTEATRNEIPREVVRSSTQESRDDATWLSESVTLNEMPSMFDTVIDRVDYALGDFDDESTLEGESLFGPSEYVRPIGLGLTPTRFDRTAEMKSLVDDNTSWFTATTFDNEASRRRSVFETIIGAFRTPKPGVEVGGKAAAQRQAAGDVERDNGMERGEGNAVTSPSSPCVRSIDVIVETLGSCDQRDENESLLDDEDDETDDTSYTLSFSPRTETTFNRT